MNAHEQLDHNMTNHAPADESVVRRFEDLRVDAKNFGHQILTLCPESRERSLAITHLEECLMQAVASIARNQDKLS